ncbi:MAG: adenylate cyclase [Gammaproteobacteria bacterium]|jgi:adenylate cyclase
MSPQKVERRLSTILAADVVGYSRMVGNDELGTINAVKAVIAELVEPKASQYDGRIVKLMGDGILMEFVSVVDAIQFAVEMQGASVARNSNVEPNRQIVFRIGINIGDIIVDGDDIHGNGVNIAARLESLASHGGIFLSDAAYTQARGKLQLNFQDEGSHQVKNIADPIAVFSVIQDDRAAALLTEIVPLKSPWPTWLIPTIAALSTLLVIGTVSWWFLADQSGEQQIVLEQTLALPNKPSIAVLPFQVIGDSDETRYFVDGLTNDLITDLSKFHGLFISASHSVFELEDKNLPVKEIAERLGVRYVLQGSARGSQSRIRVNVELVEASSGTQLWAERYDRELADVFAVQDEIIQSTVSVLTVKLDENELARSLAKHPSSLQAYDYVLRGNSLMRKNNREDNYASQGMFKAAIEIDPIYGEAYTGLGSAVLRATTDGWSNNPQEGLKKAHDLAQAAIDIDPHPEAHTLLGWTYLLMKHFDLAKAELDRAISFNPNDALSFAVLGGINLWSSHLEDAVIAYKRSIRLNPETSAEVLTGLGITYFLLQQFDQALSMLQKSVASFSDDPLTQAILAATYKKLNKEEGALAAVEKTRKLHPFFSSESYRRAFPNPDHGNFLAEGLLAAGFK